MALTITEGSFDPEDPDGPFRRLSTSSRAAGDRLAESSPWVTPDYSTVAKDSEMDGPGPYRNWPGPPIIMPAGLLPDGKPHGRDERENSARIEGVWPRTEAEADACVRAYWGQQDRLRRAAGIELSFRTSAGEQDTPEALAAIREIHRRERERRQLHDS